MLCGICKEKEATVFYTEIINGAKKEQYLCGECAAKSTGLRLKAPFGNGEFSLGTLLSGLFEESVPGEEKGEDVRVAEPGSKLSCPGCGMTYPKFLEGGVLGCPSCYQSFGRTLLRKIRSKQGADVHTGRGPKHFTALKEAAKTQEMAPKLDERARLSMQLKQAVEREDYELAARLRDALRAARKQEAGCLDE
ncbi:MAG: UvrB/UvrC motif-containing protein [Lachnospiraceae bacterium]|nr:UvrB/UvrC motif-containing protein [Lachnospiraceae bacterium]